MAISELSKCSKGLIITLVIFLSGIVVPAKTYAQGSGKIAGTVIDKVSGDVLPGANVYLDGTSIGASTGIDGDYVILSVPEGSYNLVVKYIGYKDLNLPVTVVADETVTQILEVEYVAIEGEAIEITAQAEGQIAAINQQLASNTIKNIVSADRIQDVPDVNAAESVSRLPGISLIRSGGEGQKVTIRGMSPKYNVMQVNGVRMQSTDREDRSVDLNMINPNVLEGIEVTKALTADMDADAVGGTVNLKIGKAKKGFNSRLAVQNGYGSLAETFGNYRVNALASDRYLNDNLGVQLSGFLDNFNRNSDVLSASWDINREAITEEGSDLLVSELVSSTLTDRVTDRRRLGAGLILDYRFSFGSMILNNFISNLNEQQNVVGNTLGSDGAFSAYGAINEVSNTILNNALQGEFEFFDVGLDFSFSNSVSKQHHPGNLRMNIWTGGQTGINFPEGFDKRHVEPDEFLNTVTVKENELGVFEVNTTERDVTESSREAILNFKIPFTFTNFLSGNLKFGGKYIHTARDNDETQYFNNPGQTEIGGEFMGLLVDSLWRDLRNDPLEEIGTEAYLWGDPDYDIGDFLSGQEGVDHFYFKPDFSKMKRFERLAFANTVTSAAAGLTSAYPIKEQPSRQYDYKYSRDLSAFYIQTELNIGSYATLYPGARYENYEMDYTAYFTERYGPNPLDYRSEKLNVDTINVIKGDHWFPQMHLRIKPLDWLDVRLASTKSIIYPDYGSVSPYRYLNTYSAPTLLIGNPYLKPALSQNYDIYTSVYDNYIGLFTAGYFYKEVTDLIVSTSFLTKDASEINNLMPLSSAQDTRIDTWENLEATSYVRGFELDWQTHFWYLPSFLKGMVFNINYTHITSETTYPFQTSVKIGSGPFARTVFVDSSRSGRMPNQPDDILNITVGYDIGGFSARLSFLYQDDVITSIHRTWEELDVYTDTQYRWDFTAYQKLPWYEGLQVYLNINNISNEPDRRVVSTLKKLSSVEYYGMTTDLGIRYTF